MAQKTLSSAVNVVQSMQADRACCAGRPEEVSLAAVRDACWKVRCCLPRAYTADARRAFERHVHFFGCYWMIIRCLAVHASDTRVIKKTGDASGQMDVPIPHFRIKPTSLCHVGPSQDGRAEARERKGGDHETTVGMTYGVLKARRTKSCANVPCASSSDHVPAGGRVAW